MSGPTTTPMPASGPALPMSAETTAALLAQDPLAGLPASTHSLHMAAHQTALKHISPAGSANSPQSLALQQHHHAMQQQYAMQMPLPMQAMPHAVPHGTPVKAYMATAGTLAPGSVVVAGLSPASASKNGSPATGGAPQHAHHMAIPFSQLPNGAASFAQSHTSPGAPVAATVAASSAHHPAQAHLPNGSALAVPSGAPVLARRPSAQASSTPVMATVLDGNSRPTAAAAVASHAQPHLATPANSSNGATLAAIPTATRKTSPMPKQQQSQQQQQQQQQHQVAGLVTATIVDEKSAAALHPHQHAARPVPASAIGGQKVVTATIIPASVAGRMHQSMVPARPIGGGATNNGQRQRKRSLKAGGGGGGGRAKLSQPDALSDVEDGESITRCICGSSEDDGFMICCEACGAWQHGDCVGLDPDHVPEEYLCDLCDPQGEIHQARHERLSLAGGGGGSSSDSRRKRRRRGESKHISLGKKKGRRTSRTGRVVQGSYAQQEDGYSSGDGSSQHSGGSYGDSSADGVEEEGGGGGPVDHDGDTHMASRSSRRSRTTKPSSGGHPLTGGSDAPHPGDSPVLESPNDDSQLLSPTLTSAAVTPAYHANAAGHVPPLRVTSSAEGTPAASPTGETKLRSLIFFSEQLANGQMTSPISSTAGLALNQLGQPYKYTYPSFGARPSGDGGAPGGTGGAGGAVNGNASGAGGVSEDGKECFSPLILHRQVSENTANAAMMVAGFSAAPTNTTATATDASTTASTSNHSAPSTTHPHPPQQVKLEVFSPVLPPSLLRIPTSSEATHIPIATSTDVEAYRAHRLAQQQAKRRDDEAEANSHEGAPFPSKSTTSHLTLQTDASPLVGSKSLFSGQQSPPLLSMSPTALLGLMSPATHAAVSTLRSVATTKKENAPVPPRDELALGQ